MSATGWNFDDIPDVGGAPDRDTAHTDRVLTELLAARAFDFANPPERPCPVFTLGGDGLCTPGNLTNIQAPPKAGKSAVVESLIAAAIKGNRTGLDTLGFAAENPAGLALIHLDTEQSPFDHDRLVRRALRRAGVESPVPWLLSYSVVDLCVEDRRRAVRLLMEHGQQVFGGVFAGLIDGVGDLCLDPNDSAESFSLVNELHTLTVVHSTVIITVLHENPGSETGKTRGHLGSQLERKTETNLRLLKDKNNVTTMWAEKARHLHLSKDQGICFTWNDQAAMHTTCGTAGEIRQMATREQARDEAARSFGGRDVLGFTCLVDSIREALSLGESSAKKRIKAWGLAGVICKDSTGAYRQTPPCPTS